MRSFLLLVIIVAITAFATSSLARPALHLVTEYEGLPQPGHGSPCVHYDYCEATYLGAGQYDTRCTDPEPCKE